MRKISPWRGDRWSPVVSRVLERRLARHRDRLAKIVGLVERTEIDEMILELATELRRTWAICRDVDRARSDAGVWHALADLIRHPDEISKRVWATDPNTRSLIEEHAPDSHPFLEQLETRPDLLLDATREAHSKLPAAGRGRPRSVVKRAERHFALQLAQIYQMTSGRRPARRYNPWLEMEYGPFRDFVEIVLEVLPRRVRGFSNYSDTPAIRSVDTLTKLAINLYRESRSSDRGRR